MSDLRSKIQAAAKVSPREALSAILDAVHAQDFNPGQTLMLARSLSKISIETFTDAGFLIKKIAVLSGYTFQVIQPWLQLHLLKRGIFAQLWVSQYGLYEEAILSQDPELQLFAPDLCYFYVGRDHLHHEMPETEIERWLSLWKRAHHLLNCEIITNDFELQDAGAFGNYEVKYAKSTTNYILDVNRALALQAPPYVHFNGVSAMARFHGTKVWRDDRLYDISKIPVAEPFWTVYADNLAAVVAAVYGKNRKCLVVDLDNTLWGGVVGDDGVSGIHIGEDSSGGEGFRRFQTAIKALKNRGVLLAVCSKNDLETAQEPFTKRSEMVLKLEDFSYFCANWQPKDQNLIDIAAALNIGLDSLVFVDDNPAEREIVRRSLQQVAILDLPDDPADYARTLGQSTLLDVVTLTDEDIHRTASYRSAIERNSILTKAGDYNEYLRSLDMTGVISPFDDVDIPRITQLVNKTNQFNLTTRRYTETQIRGWMKNSSTLTFSVKLGDRFSQYGLISVFMATMEKNDLNIDTWLMSCRVLKRGVERALFQRILQGVMNLPLQRILGRYVPTAKNAMVADFYPQLGFTLEKTEHDGSTLWVFDLNDKQGILAQLSQSVFIEVGYEV
jgi:FkbH-like protein